MPHELATAEPDFERRFADFLAAQRETQEEVDRAVAAILADVRARGDAAVLDFTRRFDRVELAAADLRITAEEVEAAKAACAARELDALAEAAERIVDYHRRQTPEDLDYRDAAGVRLGHRWTALASAGLYVPGGTAAYPSSVLMNALPAKVAGVERLVMVVPAPEGRIAPLVLAAAATAGVDEIYRIGGAQAVAALAYGTETIPPVDKIVGPGNAYVAAAKRQVFGAVGIDLIAGPSEILVVADGRNDPRWMAADLLSQAEHDTAAQAILITDDRAFARAVARAIEVHLQVLPRSEIARASWQAHGAIILTRDLGEAAALIDRIAPEHLEIATESPDDIAGQVRHAGAIFLGRHTPEALGDYVAGPNHVLPTARSARFSSGLSVLDFMKRSSLIGCTPEALAVIAPSAIALARAEGLDAHALSLTVRLADEPDA